MENKLENYDNDDQNLNFGHGHIFQIQERTSLGKHCAAPTADRFETTKKPTTAEKIRSSFLGIVINGLERLEKRVDYRQAGDGYQMASNGI
jgi:hypothetical protein